MPYFVRKVRNQDKYRVGFKDPNGKCVSLYEFESKEEAQHKMNEEIYKQIEKENEGDPDTEIEES